MCSDTLYTDAKGQCNTKAGMAGRAIGEEGHRYHMTM